MRPVNSNALAEDAKSLSRHARRAVPRYTSYPTAPHFSRSFDESLYRDWLGALDVAQPVSLYLHVPFCKQMCWYCGCNMKLASRYAPVEAYASQLIDEIDLLCAALPARLRVSHVHFGGGTPTALDPGDLARIVHRLEERFDIAPFAERAIETDPRTLSDEMIVRLGLLGFTRASIGVQEFDPSVQAAINRIQPAALVQSTTQKLRAAGVRRINFDLIYGLPAQTAEALRRTVRDCVAMKPDRVALFGYAHVPWMAKNQRMIDEAALPGPEARMAQARASAEELIAGGYVAIGIDHFALPGDPLARAAAAGRLHRNFQGYTDDSAPTLIGLGATAISRLPQGYAQNQPETGAWSRAIEAGALPVAKGLAFQGQDRLRASVIERIMCDGAVDLAAQGQLFGAEADWFAGDVPRLDALEADGLIAREGARLRVTTEGASLARVVASAFDEYLARGQARHSLAV